MAQRDVRTITALSNRSGINKNTLSKVLNGKTQPSSLTMERLITALDIPAEKAGAIFFWLTLTCKVSLYEAYNTERW